MQTEETFGRTQEVISAINCLIALEQVYLNFPGAVTVMVPDEMKNYLLKIER